jgi:PAP2 superfamily protein
MGNVSPVATTETGGHATQQDVSAAPLIVSERAGERPIGGNRADRAVVAEAQLAGGGKPVRKIRWWFEILLGVLGYYLYAEARELHGLHPKAQKALAVHNGKDLFNFEKAIHVDWEKGLQHALLPYKGFMQVVGGFYGGAHFAVTIGVLVWLLFKRPQFYRFWRTVLFVLTMVAVGIFALYPAEPPRLLKDSSGHTITVDTLSKIGGLWSYNHGVIEHISDPYAPMPSLHLGWSTWVAAALWFTIPALTWRKRLAIAAYPAAIYFAVIATGTHFVIDGVAGIALTLVVVFASAHVLLWIRKRRLLRSGGLTADGLTGELEAPKQ